MSSTLKTLVKETAVYGLSSMAGRFLNWMLTMVYVRVLAEGEFGQMTNLYAWTAIMMIVFTYGMETSFFRFASKHERPQLVYSTTLWSLGITSSLLIVLGLIELETLSRVLDVHGHEGLTVMILLITALDAFCAIPLGYLRYEQRPWWFMIIRMSFVAINVLCTLFAFYGLPWLAEASPEFWGWSCDIPPLYYILGINLIGSIIQLLMLLPTISRAEGGFDRKLLVSMLRYAWPILLLGLVGSFNTQADKLIFPELFDDRAVGNAQLGIYGASYKLAVIMVLFTQAFRYAYDPFVFAKSKEGGAETKRLYAQSMYYYTIFTLIIYLGVMSMLDILKYFIAPAYYGGLPAVPIVMAGLLFSGIYFNLSLWYKLTDRTYWGAILSILGCAVMILIIILGTKHWGFMACAWASLVSNALITLVSYLLGQRYYPINYPIRAMTRYSLLVGVSIAVQWSFRVYVSDGIVSLIFNGLVLTAFVIIVAYREVPKDTMAVIRKKLSR